MSTPRAFLRTLVSFALVATFGVVAPARADMDRNAKKWLEDVKPLLLPEEEKLYKALKNNSEAAEFQKIFWARRDPNLDTPENEFKAEYEKLKAQIDAAYKTALPGSQTDCGRAHVLLGAPDAVRKEQGTEIDIGFRAPETWTYKDRPGMTFTGGSIQIAFDNQCRLPQRNKFNEQLDRVAETKIVQPNLTYTKDGKGQLVKLADQLPKPTPVQALLKTPRTDFPMTAQSVMEIRSQDGTSVYVAGLVRGDASAVTVGDAGGQKVAKVVVATHTTDAEGRVQKSQDREVAAVVSDGGFVAGFGMALRPGEHVFRIGVVDPKSGKGAVAELPVKTQTYGAELVLSPVLVLAEIQDNIAKTNDEPFAEFVFGTTRFVPRYGNAFRQSEAVNLLCAIYGAAKDEAGKISVAGGFEILKDGKTIARAPDQTFDTDPATPSAGPVPLGNYPPGKYLARVRLRDNIAKKDYTQETAFEIVP
jgi:GWxTD domain-containing protein